MRGSSAAHAALVKATLKSLKLIGGVHAMRMNAGGILIYGKDDSGRKTARMFRGHEKGTPDIMVMLPAERVVWLEAKTGEARPSKEQRKWHERATGLGHVVHVYRDVREAMRIVQEAKR